ncbi:GntR family transcriptional regulator [Saccharopolyspora subtropica]|uniref:GntR family transcriptional regulator n=1 Tax=Saccharopolyspora thermophila TaxID=89367 RepID=A0A917NF66_9PSEU|nr:GntR family transcriptional regulator [Saccharopolyspora subtropica]GGI92002.1 GntR family transcriptional regulator [Saccharopolyspora subtropica]
MALPRLVPNSRVGDQVFETIRTAIISGELPAGHRLRIRELADELGTSVMPVREAIRRLEEIGLAEALPYRGAVVKGFTYKELLDLYSVRRTLEIQATELGTTRLTRSDVEQMEAAYDAMAAAVAAQHAVDYLARDEDFLTTIYTASDNSVLVEMIHTLWQRCRSYKIVGVRREFESGDSSLLLVYQEQLLDAVKSGDAEAAVRVTAASIDAATRRIEQALSESGSAH